MVIHKLWRFLLGSVKFKIDGGQYEKFLNDCTGEGFSITEVTATPLGLEAIIPAREYKKLHSLAYKRRCRLHIINKTGLCFNFIKYKKRIGIPIGILLFGYLVFWLQGFVWTISYYEMQPKEAIIIGDILRENGISQGTRVTSEQMNKVRNNILLDGSNFSSLSLNFVKGRLIVDATTIIEKPEISNNIGVADIVAKKDGIISSVEVISGFSVCGAGQYVTKGDILISGSYIDEYTGYETTNYSDAKVMAQTQTIYQYKQPMTVTENIATGEIKNYRSICVGDKKIPLYRPRELAGSYTQTVSEKPVKVFSLPLPLSLETIEISHVEKKTVNYSDDMATEKARLSCETQMREDMKGGNIISYEGTSEIKNDEAIYTLKVLATEDIGEILQR